MRNGVSGITQVALGQTWMQYGLEAAWRGPGRRHAAENQSSMREGPPIKHGALTSILTMERPTITASELEKCINAVLFSTAARPWLAAIRVKPIP